MFVVVKRRLSRQTGNIEIVDDGTIVFGAAVVSLCADNKEDAQFAANLKNSGLGTMVDRISYTVEERD